MIYSLLTLVDWALIAGSLFNTIVLLWLGLTVLLSAERRSWGTWLAGGGLLFGGAFFVGHTAVVGRVLGAFSDEMVFYWRLGWLVLIVAPYLWYAVMAWYSGALSARPERLRLAGVSLLGALAVLLAVFVDPLPSYAELARPPVGPAAVLSGATLARLIYPGFAALCIVLALLTLRAPEVSASERFMGDLARRRARPWLMAASAVLLTIALAIGVASVWFLDQARAGLFPGLTAWGISMLIGFDLLICLLIAAAAALIGRAVVAYEVFTGAALPRGELARQWRRVLVLGGIYSLAVGWSLSGAGIPDQPIYQLLIATVLMATFLALLGWRSAGGPASGLARLRPLVASQNLYDRLLGPGSAAEGEPEAAFHALCGELLGARAAYLLPLGSLADLAGPALAHPHGQPPDVGDLAAAIQAAPPAASGQPPICQSVDPARYGGAGWAVPLRNDRGLIGLLLLGEKRDGGIYTQEEMEVARAAGERLIDARAAAEMALRLAALQRRRLAESQVLDRRTRRVLHDEVLPQIHATLLQIADCRLQIEPGTSAEPNLQSAIYNLQSTHRQISDLLHDLPPAIGPDLARLGALGALRRAIESDLGGAFDHVRWEVPPAAEEVARGLDALSAEALYYAAREAVRNAARHGRGQSPGRALSLTVRAADPADQGGRPLLEVCIEDDGVGFSPAPARGDGGHGLALHSTLLAIMGGTLSVSSAPAPLTRVTISMPVAR